MPLCPSKRMAQASHAQINLRLAGSTRCSCSTGQFEAAHFAVLCCRPLASKLAKGRKRVFLLAWKRGRHFSHSSFERRPTNNAAIAWPLSSCATDTNPELRQRRTRLFHNNGCSVRRRILYSGFEHRLDRRSGGTAALDLTFKSQGNNSILVDGNQFCARRRAIPRYFVISPVHASRAFANRPGAVRTAGAGC